MKTKKVAKKPRVIVPIGFRPAEIELVDQAVDLDNPGGRKTRSGYIREAAVTRADKDLKGGRSS